jgi:P27 family predicted phage terminase small subunit
MPAQTVVVETMEIGKKGRGKHWTTAQVTARAEAAEKLKRKKKAELIPPSWLSPRARDVWNRKIEEVAGLNAANVLLDVLDTEMLAIYCDAYVEYQITASVSPKTSDMVKELQAYARILAGYAEKLGFTPNARARLVKKLADESPDKFGKKFD